MGIFDVYNKKPARNHFPLSHSRKYTMQQFGVLYPILCVEGVPGDVFKHSHEHFLQFMPMSSTVLHRFNVQTFYFYVPNRLLWDEFDDFISMDPNKFDAPPTHPYVYLDELTSTGTGGSFRAFITNCSLADYLGYRTFFFRDSHYRDLFSNSSTYYPNWISYGSVQRLNALPFRAYQKIWFDYFRDEECNASNNEKCSTSGGSAFESALLYLRSKTWKKDPFTTSLKSTTPHGYVPMISGTFDLDALRYLKSETTFFEKIMRSGSRPQEFIHGIFGVKPADYRLDMPEFLSATESTIVMGNVFNSTSALGTAEYQQLGYTASTAKSASVAGGFKYRVKEFGWLIGLACIVPDSLYFQGLPRQLSDRNTNLDYPFPDFAYIGDQAIKNKEIFDQWESDSSINVQNESIFAFAPRYWEYKYIPSTIHGAFKNEAWLNYTDARILSGVMSRNSNFTYIAGNADGSGRVSHLRSQDSSYFDDPFSLKRIFAVSGVSSGNLYPPIAMCDIYHHFSALRPFPYSSLPRL